MQTITEFVTRERIYAEISQQALCETTIMSVFQDNRPFPAIFSGTSMKKCTTGKG